jgi:hypothetical protein
VIFRSWLTCTVSWIYINIQTQCHAWTRICIGGMYVSVYVCLYICVRIYVYVCVHIYIYIYIIYTYTYVSKKLRSAKQIHCSLFCQFNSNSRYSRLPLSSKNFSFSVPLRSCNWCLSRRDILPVNDDTVALCYLKQPLTSVMIDVHAVSKKCRSMAYH